MITQMLDQLGDVYTENAATGKFDTLARAGLACRLVFARRLAHDEDGRRELVGLRNLLFEAAYAMPETCQVDVDGIRWQPRPGTFFLYRDWNGNPAYRECMIERQEVTAF